MSEWEETPGDEILRPLTKRVAGGIRTHNHFLRKRKVLHLRAKEKDSQQLRWVLIVSNHLRLTFLKLLVLFELFFQPTIFIFEIAIQGEKGGCQNQRDKEDDGAAGDEGWINHSYAPYQLTHL